jgi:O-antigen/teichoic acid export membrane protein
MTTPASRAAAERAAFFRQGGWMMVATVLGGAMTWAVHLLNVKIPAAEYGTLGTLFAIVNLIPTMPLQMVFAQQTALAQATGGEAMLSGLIRRFWLGILVVWAVGSAGVWCFHADLTASWHLANPVALPGLLIVILFSLWWPVLAGVLQGRQDFLWLGGCTILNGTGRLGAALVIVLLCSGYATGIMAAVALGLLLACTVAAAQTRAQWRTPPGPVAWPQVRRQVIPLMLGFAATQFLFCADTVFVNVYFGAERTAPYVAAGTFSRALLWLVLPLAGVMFPKLVRSHVAAEKNNLPGLTLLVTGAMATAGFLGLWLLGPWLMPLVYRADYSTAALAVLPWYAGAMIPLALGNVLVNDMLARSQFRIVPVLVFLAAAYAVTLLFLHQTPTMVLQVLCAFNLLLLAVCAGFLKLNQKN